MNGRRLFVKKRFEKPEHILESRKVPAEAEANFFSKFAS
jgi:hypothetical protein